MSNFPECYGEWALVAGASEGLGAAFAEQLAARRMNVILLARRAKPLAELAGRLSAQYEVETRWEKLDLSGPDLASRFETVCGDVSPGLLVYNAALIPTGPFAELAQDTLEEIAQVNVLGPLTLVRALIDPMRERGRGAVVLMSSMSGLQGWPGLAAYSATKAFNTTLGEALWYELGGEGIDVVVSCPGAISTPGYFRNFGRESPGMLPPDTVARATLDALGKGPRVVPGLLNRIGWQLITRALPRRPLIRLTGKMMKKVI
ncbi:MAG: SDR family NAD(P)-dependent oxidoreductase [Gammaproteobacteria bacterium]|nr:SDR family NAD(P)-dependent oxidoreductase [Gammaproteobacteria bacterium]